MATRAPDERVRFAQQLRGVAALCVVCLHLGVGDWAGQGFVHHSLGVPLPAPATTLPWWTQALHHLQTLGTDRPYLDLGAFGVALFFFISGFVIPFSLNRLGPWRFVLARIVRIYPVYWVGLLLWWVVWQWTAWRFGARGGGDIPGWQWLAHAFMVADAWGLAPLDGVSWTLQIELRFYRVAVLGYAWVRRLTLRVVWLFWGAVLVAGGVNWLLLRHGGWAGLTPTTTFVLNQNLKQLAFVGYIFGGYVLYLHWQGRLGLGRALTHVVAVQAAVVLMMQFCGVNGTALKVLVLSQLLATAVCVTGMQCAWQWMQRPLGFLADISYPLYMVHLPVGWLALSMGAWWHWPPGLAMAFALAGVMGAAWGVHRWVERPTLQCLERLKRGAKGATAARAPTTARAA